MENAELKNIINNALFKSKICVFLLLSSYYENHDLTKGGFFIRTKLSGLNIDDFEKVLRYLAFLSAKEGKLEYSKDALLELINKAKVFCSELKFNASDFLHDIVSSVPLFKEEGLYYKWTHKSMQDYFVARFIYTDTKENQKKILLDIFKSKECATYLNILDIFFEMDYKTFRNTIIYTILCDFMEYHKKIIDGITDKNAGSIFFRKAFSEHSSFSNWLFKKAKSEFTIDEIKDTFDTLDLFYFDYNKCMALKRQIEENIKLENNSDFFSIN